MTVSDKRFWVTRGLSWRDLCYSKEAPGRHTATVIWLHGLGDTGEGWMDVGPQLQMQFPFVAWWFKVRRLSVEVKDWRMAMYNLETNQQQKGSWKLKSCPKFRSLH